MDALEAYDLTNSYRSAALLAGCDDKTVKRLVTARSNGIRLDASAERPKLTDGYADTITNLIERSKGVIAADVVHDKIVAQGYEGSERTTRRVVAVLKKEWAHENRRSYMPWITEPGLWLQWDYGWGPVVNGIQTHPVLCLVGLVAIPDRAPTTRQNPPERDLGVGRVFPATRRCPNVRVDRQRKTVTDRHIAALPVRNPQILSAAHYYGVKIETCAPADPESKGGSEATVKIAKADLVPSQVNLRTAYDSWDALDAACVVFMDRVNGRVHRVTNETPVARLERELRFLHPVPAAPYTAAFGETRKVSWSQTIQFRGSRYSVPRSFCDQTVWVRVAGNELVISGAEGAVTVEAARHRLVGAGQTCVNPAHYPGREPGVRKARVPKASTRAETAFLQIGDGAVQWLIEATSQGVRGIEVLMSEAVELLSAHDADVVDAGLGAAAVWHRFEAGDVESIVLNTARPVRQIDPSFSLQTGTAGWAGHTDSNGGGA